MLSLGGVGVLVALAGFGALALLGAQGARHRLTRGEVVAAYGRLPLSFAQNRGQAPAGVEYVASGAGWSLGLGNEGAQLAVAQGRHRGSALRVMTPGGRLRSPVALRRLPGRASYFVGADRARWVVGAPTFAQVVYRDVWPGVDVAFHGHSGSVEFDLDFAPGADPGRVALRFAGARAVRPDGRGGAVIALAGGRSIGVLAPRAMQGAHRVLSRLVVRGDTIRVALGAYDRARALVVDPTLVYHSDVAGGSAIAVDSAGDAYVTGGTSSRAPGPAYVAKLNPAGRALVYSTSLGGDGEPTGGNGATTGDGIALDASGDAYVTGFTNSPDFPTTPGAFQTSCGSKPCGFVTKLNPTGSALVYSTYLGDQGNGIALDSAGDAYVTGAPGPSFPTTPGAYQTSCVGGNGCGFVAKLNVTGSALAYSTYLGTGNYSTGYHPPGGIAVDSAGDAYVTGATSSTDFPTTPGAFQTNYSGSGGNVDAFVTKLNPTGSALVYSTYLGGAGATFGNGIALDSADDAYVTGDTNYSYSTQFPTTPGAYQTKWHDGGDHAFVTKLNPAGSALVYSTYLGSGVGRGIAVDASDDAYITGVQVSHSGTVDGSLIKLNPAGSALLYSTHVGCGYLQCGPLLGNGVVSEVPSGIAVDPAGNTYVTGQAANDDALSTGGFVDKFSLGADVLWAPRVSPRRFTLTGRRVDGRCVQRTRANHNHTPCTRPIRLSLGYQLSAPARVSITIARLLPGRLTKGRCVKPARKNQKHRRCTRVLSVRGALAVNGQPGSNNFTFNGRIGGHKLGPSRYRLALTPAVDGQSGAPWTITFRIAP